jgi:hypothetical protein
LSKASNRKPAVRNQKLTRGLRNEFWTNHKLKTVTTAMKSD